MPLPRRLPPSPNPGPAMIATIETVDGWVERCRNARDACRGHARWWQREKTGGLYRGGGRDALQDARACGLERTCPPVFSRFRFCHRLCLASAWPFLM